MVVERVAVVSMHTSPADQAGTADSGGMNVSILAIAAELVVRGTSVDLLTRAAGNPSSRVLLPGVTLHELPAGDPGPLDKGEMKAVTDEFGEAVADLARRTPGGYDIIHAHYWLSGIATLPVALELDIPFVQNFHTIDAMKNKNAATDDAAEPVVRVRSEAYLAGQADAVIASSSAEATFLIDEVGAPADRTWIIPPGVDLALFSPRQEQEHERVRAALKLDPERPLVVLAARVQPLKGHELAIQALAEIRALRGWAPLLVIAGDVTPGQSPFAARLHSLARELGVQDNVRFVGALHRDTLADLLSAASVTIVPSFSYTFGLVALESAAAGTPVIGFRSGGLAESIEDGVSGMLLGTRDPRYWATEIALLIENDERRAELSASARRHAERFTWASAATSLLGVYAGVGRP
ncbi:glycosyltransferase [soil metagenome]